jgi:hypothetical protein
MDRCVKGMLISVLLQLFLMVFPSVPRTVSKSVSVEQDEYLNCNDVSPTKCPLNI